MMHLEADVFRKFDKQWALVTAGTPEHYNTMTISWAAWAPCGDGRWPPCM